MKSKSYILMQIHDLLINRHSYTASRANNYIEEHKEDKVYELLVLKKKLLEAEPTYPDVSFRKSMWRDIEED
jgi:hypothetical protein